MQLKCHFTNIEFQIVLKSFGLVHGREKRLNNRLHTIYMQPSNHVV